MNFPNHFSNRIISPIVCLLIVLSCDQQNRELSDIKLEMEQVLSEEMFDVWYPRAIDTVDGGYLTGFDYQWNPVGIHNKSIVNQARHLWTLSVAAERFPENTMYASGARHGFEFIRDKMWDHEFGGFFDLRTKTGDAPGNSSDEGESDSKRAYGNAFGIFSLATYARIANDSAVLDLAKQAFRWVEAHAYDTIYGGYNQYLTREGIPYHLVKENIPYWQYFKDQNYTIHLLEAYTSLYQVWPDEELRAKLNDLILLIRDKITNEEGYMTLFFYQDWSGVSFRDSAEINYQYDHVSFGHDIETAYLLLDASKVLGLDDPKTLAKTTKMVDHSLKGLDPKNGGLFYKGYYFSDTLTIVDEKKSWWPQAEGLNTLLIFSGLYPNDKKYKENFISLWKYTSTYQIDHEHGGWYSNGIDYHPEFSKEDKAGLWKTPYHSTRALINCIDMIEERTSN